MDYLSVTNHALLIENRGTTKKLQGSYVVIGDIIYDAVAAHHVLDVQRVFLMYGHIYIGHSAAKIAQIV
ncbi:hypothetical protein [uncultured Bacteroides sp.]|uniref:hypothetical protein n=1 Tax=uncultured Bacteroides sp. TaxID=162156 RepID=UPI00258BB902|nr:hypothetical protein [uncultured Bacteroides sp.]